MLDAEKSQHATNLEAAKTKKDVRIGSSEVSPLCLQAQNIASQ